MSEDKTQEDLAMLEDTQRMVKKAYIKDLITKTEYKRLVAMIECGRYLTLNRRALETGHVGRK